MPQLVFQLFHPIEPIEPERQVNIRWVYVQFSLLIFSSAPSTHIFILRKSL